MYDADREVIRALLPTAHPGRRIVLAQAYEKVILQIPAADVIPQLTSRPKNPIDRESLLDRLDFSCPFALSAQRREGTAQKPIGAI